MPSQNTIGERVRVAQADEQAAADEGRTLTATVDLEIQAKVDTNHPDARPEGMTLAAEEKFRAREQEIRRTRERRNQTEQRREACSRQAAARGREQQRATFEQRAASVDPWQAPDEGDPRDELGRDDLAAVNREAARIVERVDGWMRSAVSRRLAEHVVDGTDVTSAVVATVEELQMAPGTVIPIGCLEDVRRETVSIEGHVAELWNASHPAISQVGLLEDETGRTKWTAWKRSDVPVVDAGERVRFRSVATSWYDGRVSVALTGDSQVFFPEREAWTE